MSTNSSSPPPETLTATQLGVVAAVFIGSMLLLLHHQSGGGDIDSLFYLLFMVTAIYYVVAEYSLEDSKGYADFQALCWNPSWGWIQAVRMFFKRLPVIRSCPLFKLANFEFSFRVGLATLFGVVIAYPDNLMFGINEIDFRLFLMAFNNWMMLCWDLLIVAGAGRPTLVKPSTITTDIVGLIAILSVLVIKCFPPPSCAPILIKATMMALIFFYLFFMIEHLNRLIILIRDRRNLR
jgi:hypothetical protein